MVPIRRLLTTTPEARIDSIMIDDVEAIPSWATVLVAAEYFVNRRFLAFPVVEPGGRLVGVVDVSLFTDDVLTLARQSFDGIFQLIGVHATEGRTAWTSFLDRLPWLLCNVAGGLMCAVLASYYEGLLEHLVVLALFIPVVLTLAEAVSIQSLTLTLQNLSDGPIHWAIVARGVGQGVPDRADAWPGMRVHRRCGRIRVEGRYRRGLRADAGHHGGDDHGVPARRADAHGPARVEGRPEDRGRSHRARA